jgi:hypothetical protein
MDDHAFDRLTRCLTSSSTRRGIVASLTSALLAFVPLALSGDDAAARRKHKRKKRKKKQSEAAPVPPPLPESPPPSPPPPPPSPPPCVGSCAGKRCGDDGCGGSCGVCAGGSVCESGQCVAACCAAGISCFGDYCTCDTSGSDFCSCPADDVICNGAGCCLAEDTCLTPMDCFDGEICACSTQTCGAGNDACREEFAFCGNGAPGTCGCFTRADDTPFCATIPAGPFCPPSNECERDDDCGDGKVCAKVPCCNPGVEPFVGWCLAPCPES